jgi:rhodanese-related sulfurtransferase
MPTAFSRYPLADWCLEGAKRTDEMSRMGIKLLALVGLLLLLFTSACGGEVQPTTVPTAAPAATATLAPQGRTDFDMTPVLRDFLGNLPSDGNLVEGQQVAATKPFVVDVRQPDEYGKGFIEGAVNVPIRELAHNLQALPALDKDIVVVCDSGHRSAIGMAVLQMLGYKRAKSLAGGMQAWQAAKLPSVTEPIPKLATGPAPKLSPAELVDADVQATLDHYLAAVLPDGWGLMTSAELVEDQAKKSNLELEPQPDHYEQGASIVVDVDEPDAFAKGSVPKAINIPLRGLPDNLERIPQDEITLWA